MENRHPPARVRRTAHLRGLLVTASSLALAIVLPALGATLNPTGGGSIDYPSGTADDQSGSGGAVAFNGISGTNTFTVSGVALNNTTGSPITQTLKFEGTGDISAVFSGAASSITYGQSSPNANATAFYIYSASGNVSLDTSAASGTSFSGPNGINLTAQDGTVSLVTGTGTITALNANGGFGVIIGAQGANGTSASITNNSVITGGATFFHTGLNAQSAGDITIITNADVTATTRGLRLDGYGAGTSIATVASGVTVTATTGIIASGPENATLNIFGKIAGNIVTDAGNDTIILTSSATAADGVVTGTIDGGTGTNGLTLNGTSSSASFDVSKLSNISSLAKSGTGTWTLSSTNSATIATTISGGILNVSADGALGGNTGGLTLAGGTLQLGASFNLASGRGITLGAGGGTIDTNSFDTTISQAIGDGGGGYALTKTGAGTLTLSGSNSYSGGTVVKGGTLSAGSDSNLGGSGGVTLDGGTLRLGASSSRNFTLGSGGGTFDIIGGTVSLSGAIGGSGGLTKTGGSQLRLNGSNSYDGSTIISGGSLLVSGAFSGTGAITISGGSTLILNGAHTLSNSVTIGSGGASINASNSGSTLSGNVTGGNAFNKTGGQKLTLSGGTVTLGAVTVTGGELQIGASGAIPTTTLGALSVGGTLSFYGSSGISNGSTITGGGAVNLYGAGSLTLSGDISGFSGGLDASSATNGSLILSGGTGFDGTVATASGGSLTVNTGNNVTYGGVLSGGGLTKSGTGKLTLSATDTYGGATTVNAGTLAVNGSLTASATTVNSGGTLGGSGSVQGVTIANGGILAPGNSIGTLTVNGDLAINTGATYAVELDASSADKTIVTGNVTIGGGATLALSPASVTYTAGTVYTLLTYAGISGTFGTLNTGGGFGDLAPVLGYGATSLTLTLDNLKWTGASDAQWDTDANWNTGVRPGSTADAHFVNGASNLGIAVRSNTSVGSLTFESGAPAYSLSIDGGGSLATLTITGAGIVNSSSNTQSLLVGRNGVLVFGTSGGAGTGSVGNVTLQVSDIIGSSGEIDFYAHTSAGTATIVGNWSGVIFHDNSTAANAAITGHATFRDNATAGAATLTNITNASFVGSASLGSATISTLNSGFVYFYDSATGGSGGISLTSGTLDISGLSTAGVSLGTLSGDSGSTVQLGAKTLTVGDAASTAFAGVIQESGGAGKLVKQGSGSLTLSGASTYTGSTTVNAGTLLLTGSIASSSGVSVQSGATLAGTGTAAAVTLAGGTIAPGASAGATGTLSAASLSGSGIFAMDLSGSATDLFSVTAGSIGAGSTLNLTGNAASAGTYTLIHTTAGLTGTFDTVNYSGFGALITSLDYSGTDLVLTLLADRLWTGAASSTFGDSGNWSGGVPASGQKGVFEAVSNRTVTVADSSATAGTLQFDAAGYALNVTASSANASLTLDDAGITTSNGNAPAITLSQAGGRTATLTLSASASLGAASVSNGGTLAFTGSANGANAVVVQGAGGVLDVSGAASGVTLARLSGGGTVQLGGKSLTFGDSASVTFGGVFTGSGGLTKKGAGTVILTGDSTGFTGSVQVDGGVLQLGNGGTSGSLNDRDIALASGAGLAVNRSSSLSHSGIISGNGGLTQAGSGALTLTGNNTYAGATLLNAGTLIAGSSTAFGSGAVTMASGTTLGLSGASIANNIGLAGSGTVLLDTGQSEGLSGVISDAGTPGTLVKSGSGTLILTGNNTYTGGTIINGGTVFIGSTNPFLSTSGALGSGNVVNNGMLVITRLDPVTIAGDVSGSGSLSVGTGLSGGSVTLSGNNSYSGTTTVTNGWLLLAGSASGLSSNSALTITSSTGAGVALNGFSSTIGSLASTGPTASVSNTSTTAAVLTTGGNNSSTSYAGRLMDGTPSLGVTGAALGLTKIGTGTFTLTGNGQTYTGLTTISAGTLALSGTATLATSSGVVADGVFSIQGITGTSATIKTLTGSGSVTMGAKSLVLSAGAGTFSGAISGSGGLTQSGSGTLVLSGANAYTGATAISAGTLAVSGSIASSSGVTVQNGATLAGSGTVGATTVQSGAALSPGNAPGETATLTVSGNLALASGSATALEFAPSGSDKVSVSGTAAIDGTLFVNFAGVSGYTAGQYALITSTGLLSGTYSGFNTLGSPSGFTTELSYDSHNVFLNLTASTFIWGADPGGSDWNAAATWQQGVVPMAANTAVFGATANSAVTIAQATAVKSLQFNSGAPDYSFTIAGTAAGAASLTVATGGIVNNSANAPDFAVSGVSGNAGTLSFNGSGNAANAVITAGAFGTVNFNALTDAGAGASLIAASGGTVDFSASSGANGDNMVTAGSIAGAGGFMLGANTLTVGALNTSTEVSGTISGSGGLVKTGSGMLVLSGVNTYAGTTTVNAGILDVNGSIASNVVLAGGTLKGNGAVGGISAGNGSVLAPGNSIGTLNTGAITFSSGSTYEVEVNAAGQSDLVNASGAAVLNGAVQVLPASGSYAPVTTYRIVNAGSISGTFSAVSSSVTGLTPSLIYGATTVDLKLVRDDVAFGADYGVTPNQIAAGGAVSAGGAGTALYAALASAYAPATIAGTLDDMSGEIHASLRSAMIEDSRIIRNTVLDRLSDPGSGLWAQGYAGYGELESDGNAAALHRNQAGFIVGYDMMLGDGLRAGLAGAYGEQRANAASRASHASGSGGAIIGYAGWQGGAWHVDLGGDYGWGRDSITRAIAALAESETGRQDSRSGQVFARVRYDASLAGLPLAPYFGLAHVSATTGAFAESGGLAALSGAEKTDSQTYTALGLRLTAPDLKLSAMALWLHADLGWSHALDGRTPGQTVGFATGQSFTVLGTPIGSDAANVQLGANLAITPAAILSLGYDASLSNRGSSHALRGGLEWRF